MMVISDLDDIFVPIPSGLLVNLSESKTIIDAFLDSLTSMFNDNLDMESAFGPAVKAATMVMVSQCTCISFALLYSLRSYLKYILTVVIFHILSSCFFLKDFLADA